jgi:hypothetical protein
MEQLSAIDAVRERMSVSYEEARKALETNAWNEVDAIIQLEREANKSRISIGLGIDWMERIKGMIHKGNVTQIKVIQGERIMAEFPVTAGIVGALVAPYLAVIGGMVALAGRCQIEVERGGEPQTEEQITN